MIVWIIAIGFLIYYIVKDKPGPPPPKIIDHTYVQPPTQYMTDQDYKEEYDKDHFFSVKDQCWVRLEKGVFYRSVPFEEWDYNDDDSDNSHDVVYPERLLTREEYEDDDDMPDSYYARI